MLGLENHEGPDGLDISFSNCNIPTEQDTTSVMTPHYPSIYRKACDLQYTGSKAVSSRQPRVQVRELELHMPSRRRHWCLDDPFPWCPIQSRYFASRHYSPVVATFTELMSLAWNIEQ
jgi:hypothetical protein